MVVCVNVCMVIWLYDCMLGTSQVFNIYYVLAFLLFIHGKSKLLIHVGTLRDIFKIMFNVKLYRCSCLLSFPSQAVCFIVVLVFYYGLATHFFTQTSRIQAI